MNEISKAKTDLSRAMAIEQQTLESEMKQCEDEIHMTLDEWRVRKQEIAALEASLRLKQVVKTAKVAASGRRAAAELTKYGVSHRISHCAFSQLPSRYLTRSKSSAGDQACVEAARKLLDECKKIDSELSDYFNANKDVYAMFQAMVDEAEGKRCVETGKAAGDKLSLERML
jgi:hypothetical protein